MANEVNKGQWIDDILNSSRGMAKADPGAGFYDRVTSRLAQPPKTATVIAFPVKKWAAAAILLLALNIGSVLYVSKRQVAQTSERQENPLLGELPGNTTYNY